MSYTPTQWSAGDTVTSAKLNKMEQGIAGASGANILVVHVNTIEREVESGKATVTEQVAQLDKTAREIMDADFTIILKNEESPLGDGVTIDFIVGKLEDEVQGFLFGTNQEIFFQAETENDYPLETETPSYPG